MKEFSGQVIVQAPTKVANFLLNEKRKNLAEIESRQSVPIVILANEHMQRPKFEIHRLRNTEVTADPSYSHLSEPQIELVANAETQATAAAAQAPVVQRVTHTRPAPAPEKKSKPGLFGQFFGKLFSGGEEESVSKKKTVTKKPSKKKTTRRQSQRPAQAQSGSRQQGQRQSNRRQSGQKRPADSKSAGERRSSKKKTTRSKNQSKPTKKATPKSSSQAADKSRQSTQAKTSGNTQKQEQKEGSGQRRGRRRRSPYQTTGGKQRDARPDNTGMNKGNAGADVDGNKAINTAKQIDKQSPALAQAGKSLQPGSENTKPAATQPDVEKTMQSSAQSGPEKTKDAVTKPKIDNSTQKDPVANSKSSQKQAQKDSGKQSSERIEKQTQEGQSSSRANAKPKPVDAEANLQGKSAKIIESPPETKKAENINPSVPVAATRDSKGIYTLKSSSAVKDKVPAETKTEKASTEQKAPQPPVTE